jgi:hypothetical protein
MTGPFPPEAQTRHGAADTLARDGQRMDLTEVLGQQWRCPHGGAIAQVPWVTVNHGIDQGLNNPLGRRRTTTPRAWGNANGHVLPVALLKLGDPFINHLAAHPEAVCHLGCGLALGEPQQGLDTAELLRITGRDGKAFQSGTLLRPQR